MAGTSGAQEVGGRLWPGTTLLHPLPPEPRVPAVRPEKFFKLSRCPAPSRRGESGSLPPPGCRTCSEARGPTGCRGSRARSEEALRPKHSLARSEPRLQAVGSSRGVGSQQRLQEGGDWRRVQEAGQAQGGRLVGGGALREGLGAAAVPLLAPQPFLGLWVPEVQRARQLGSSRPWEGCFREWNGQCMLGARRLRRRGLLSNRILGRDPSREVRMVGTS